VSFLIRPFAQVAAFCPLGAYLLFLALRGHVAGRQFVWFGMGRSIGVLLLLGYNFLQTGYALMMGYHMGYDQPLFELYLPGRHFIAEYLIHLLVWTFPFLPPPALLHSVWLGETSAKSALEQRWDALFLLIFLSNLLWYAFVPFHYWVGYGPRYYYASASIRRRSSFSTTTTRRSPPFYGRSFLTRRSKPAADRSGGHIHNGEASGRRHPRL
jgi:hypothetical protein